MNQTENSPKPPEVEHIHREDINQDINPTKDSSTIPELEHNYVDDAAIDLRNENIVNQDMGQTKKSLETPELEHNYKEEVATPSKNLKQLVKINQDMDQTKNSLDIPRKQHKYKKDAATQPRNHKQQLKVKTRQVMIEHAKSYIMRFLYTENPNQTKNPAVLLHQNTNQKENSSKLPKVEHNHAEDLIKQDTDQTKDSSAIPKLELNHVEAVATDPRSANIVDLTADSPKQTNQNTAQAEDSSAIPAVEHNYREAVKALPKNLHNHFKKLKEEFKEAWLLKSSGGNVIAAESIACSLPEGSSNDNMPHRIGKREQKQAAAVSPGEKRKKKQPAILCGDYTMSLGLPEEFMANLQDFEKWLLNQEVDEELIDRIHPIQMPMARRVEGWIMELKKRVNSKLFDSYFRHEESGLKFRSAPEVSKYLLYNAGPKLNNDGSSSLPKKRGRPSIDHTPEPNPKKQKITMAEEKEVQVGTSNNLQNVAAAADGNGYDSEATISDN
ncbi:unnamed protein product [Linum trigynum]|uniref:Uncharacterized protein n=1 Tax=Linum trigynum TaxID=586398 RepID=A0AAV2EHD4_9ROSI